MIFTTKTGAEVLGIQQDTLRKYATKYDVGFQPGGLWTPHLFTLDDLKELRKRTPKSELVEMQEDRVVLELGPLYNPDCSPRS